MPTDNETYTQLSTEGLDIEPCPLCGSDAELWERDMGRGPGTAKFVACSHTEALGLISGGCPMAMPPEDFYYPRKTEAINTWNDFCKMVNSMRRSSFGV